MAKGRSIALVGFMGSGKTTIGRLLAHELKMNFLDLDEYLEKKAEKKIPEIFKEFGEEFFRRMESKALEEFAARTGIVLACGGGIVEKSRNRELLKQNFFVIYLKAPFELCYERIAGDSNRPKAALSKRELEVLYSKRHLFYQMAADLVIDTEGKSVEEIVEKIREGLKIEKA